MFDFLHSSVSGIKAQNNALSHASNNIANVDTLGFKGTEGGFYSLVNHTVSAGGVRPQDLYTVDIQGTMTASPINTHIAVIGDGMFAVQTQPDPEGQLLFTRDGSFATDYEQNLVNGQGAYLMAYKIEEGGMTDKPQMGDLEVANLRSLGMEAVATSRVSVGMNLNAEETNLKGKSTEVFFSDAVNRLIGLDAPIIPDAARANLGDGFLVSLDAGDESRFVYGGLANTAKVSADRSVLGSQSVNDVFKALKEGDRFIINTPSTGDVVFSFSSNAPDVAAGAFNNMSSLAKAVSAHPDFSARLVNGGVYVAPKRAYEKMTFSSVPSNNGFPSMSSFGLEGLYGQDPARRKVQSYGLDPVNGTLGALGARDTFSQLSDGNSFNLVLDNGWEYKLTYKGNAPDASKLEFNDLASLAVAMDGVDGVSAAALGGPGTYLRIEADSSPAIFAITSNDSSMIAEHLGIKIDPTFRDKVSNGDGLAFEIGAKEQVISSMDGFSLTDNLVERTNERARIGSFLSAKGGLLSSMDQSFSDVQGPDPSGSVVKLVFQDKANLGAPNIEQEYHCIKGPDPSKVFDSPESLVTVLNNDPMVTATAVGGSIEIRPTNPGQYNLVSVESTGDLYRYTSSRSFEHTAHLPYRLLAIDMDNGERYDLVLQTVPNISDYKTGKVADVFELDKSLRYLSKDKLAARLSEDGRVVIEALPGKLATTIRAIEGGGAEALGIKFATTSGEVRFVNKTPDPSAGEFNDALSLAKAISSQFADMDATLQDDATVVKLELTPGTKLKYVADRNVSGRSDFATRMGLRGADIVAGLGLVDTQTDDERQTFATLEGLQELLELNDGMTAEVLAGDKLGIMADNVLRRVAFSNLPENSENSNFIDFLGLPGGDILEASYDPQDPSKNMSSGRIEPQYFHSLRIYDTLGSDHEVRFGFAKLTQNKWALEIFAPDKNELVTDRADGLIASATVTFDGKGKMSAFDFHPVFSGAEDGTVNLVWNNGSAPAEVTFNMGTDSTGRPDPEEPGLRQYSAQYLLEDFSQDGYGVGRMTNFEVDSDGYIVANFSNGVNKKIYQVPVADFANFNGLTTVTGTLYQQSTDSGSYTLRPSGDSSGRILSHTLEGSNVDLFKQLVRLLSSRHSFQSGVKVLQTASAMLDEVTKL